MDENSPRKYVERRRRKDWVVRSVSIVAIIGWLCAFVSLALFDLSKPRTEDMFTRFNNISVISKWDSALLRISFFSILVSLLTCIIGFLFNMTRHKRKTDRFNKAIIILGSISFIALIFFMINFTYLL